MNEIKEELSEAHEKIGNLTEDNKKLSADLDSAKEEISNTAATNSDEQTKIIKDLSDEKAALREERDALQTKMEQADRSRLAMENEIAELKVQLEKAKQASQIHISADEVNGKVELALQKMSDVCRLGHMQPSLNDGVAEMEMRLAEFKGRFSSFQDTLAARRPLL